LLGAPPGLISPATNPNATELARKAADEFARDFKCGNDEVKVIGESGTAVGLAKRRRPRAASAKGMADETILRARRSRPETVATYPSKANTLEALS
jgi:hypothetical protein